MISFDSKVYLHAKSLNYALISEIIANIAVNFVHIKM